MAAVKKVTKGFDLKKFAKAKYEPRVEEVSVPDLGAYFPEGEPPVIKVRGLTGSELARANDAVNTYKGIEALATVIATGDNAETIRQIREAIGLGDNVPAELARRLELLILGSVEPVFDRQTAVKLCANHPIEFYDLTNTITRLTGQGRVPLGKSKPSGETSE